MIPVIRANRPRTGKNSRIARPAQISTVEPARPVNQWKRPPRPSRETHKITRANRTMIAAWFRPVTSCLEAARAVISTSPPGVVKR